MFVHDIGNGYNIQYKKYDISEMIPRRIQKPPRIIHKIRQGHDWPVTELARRCKIFAGKKPINILPIPDKIILGNNIDVVKNKRIG